MPRSTFAAVLALITVAPATGAEPYRPLPRLPESEVKKRATGTPASAAGATPSAAPAAPPSAAASAPPPPGQRDESLHVIEIPPKGDPSAPAPTAAEDAVHAVEIPPGVPFHRFRGFPIHRVAFAPHQFGVLWARTFPGAHGAWRRSAWPPSSGPRAFAPRPATHGGTRGGGRR